MGNFLDHFASEIMKLRLTQSSTDNLFTLIEDLLSHIKLFALRLNDDNNGMDVNQMLDHCTSFMVEKISEYKSSFKRKRKVQQNKSHVEPQEMALGLRWDLVREHKTLSASLQYAQCKFQYISLNETLMSLFKRTDFSQTYFTHNNDLVPANGMYSDFNSGSLFQSNELFRAFPNGIQIQIGTDDVELNNALGSKATLYKVSAFYFTIRNIPQKYHSKLENIYLLLLCNTDDLKTKYTDVNDILRPIVRDLKYLEDVGLNVSTGVPLRGTLVQLCHDNLGGNITLSMVESFRTLSSFCRICICNQEESKRLSIEMPEKLRNKQMYESQIEIARNSEKVNFMETGGIKRSSKLEDLKYFHPFENFSVDIMHDLNEGVIPFLLKHLFNFCIKSKIITENDLIAKFQFYDYGFLNLECRPSVINLNKANLIQNASQSKCLFLHVPFVLFTEQQNPKLREMWVCIETLLVVTQISYSFEISETDVDTLRQNIKTHLESIQKYFNIDLLPKHHFLTHYPTVIQRMGALRPMSMMRYEAKHKVLKQMAKAGNNFKNITKTISKMHQQTIISCTESYEECVIHGPKFAISENISHLDSIVDQIDTNINSFQVNWLKYFDLKYKKGLFIVFETSFCEISQIIVHEDDFIFVTNQFDVILFNHALNSIKIKKKTPAVFKCVKFSQLKNKQVYEKKMVNESIYIIIDTLETSRCINL